MPSKRIDITLDPKILAKLDDLVSEYGSNSNRSAMIAQLICSAYSKKVK